MAESSSAVDYWASFTSPIGGHDLEIESFTATERFSVPYTIEVDVLSQSRPIDFMPLLGSGVGLELKASVKDVDRTFHGVLFRAEAMGRAREVYSYRLTLRPWLSLLQLGRNLRIFQQQTAQDVIKSIFNGAGFSDFQFKASTAGLDQREYCVQFKESDFDFVSRLMEEEGIYYYFEHAKNKHTLVLCDAPSCHTSFSEDLQVFRGEESGFLGPHLTAWERKVSPAAFKATLRDSHFRKPGQTLEAKAEESAAESRTHLPIMEIYDYPGGYGYIQDDGGLGGDRYAKVRLEEARAECDTLHGKSMSFAIAVGSKIKVKEETTAGARTLKPDEFAKFGDGEFLVVEATHTFSAQSTVAAAAGALPLGFEVEMEAVPAAVQWRAPRDTPRPVPGGPQVAAVVGVNDKKIDVDEYGRVRVHFDWDRGKQADVAGAGPASSSSSSGAAGGADDNSDKRSCWLRVAQGWADGGFGHMHIPRVGEEVIVDFLDGDPDRPIITGRVYNSKLAVPYSLPDEKTKSTWKSQTVGAAGSYEESEETGPNPGYNELRFEDKGGSEELYLHAQRIFNTLVRLDETRKTGRDTTVRVGRNRTVAIKKNETVTIETGDETRKIQAGSRTTEIQKDDTLTLNTGDSSTTVKSGDYSLKVSMGQATIEAMQKITLKVGQSTIVMTPASIEINSVTIKVNAQAMLQTKSGAMSQLDGGGMMVIKGGLTMIN